MNEREDSKFPLDGLPDGARVHWNNLDAHWLDEDMVYVELPNGLSIDAGAYGRWNDFKRVDVICDRWGWFQVESSLCRSVEEMQSEIVRLANKFMDTELVKRAFELSHWKAKRQKKNPDIIVD